MKRVGYLLEQITSLDNFYLAYQKACRGKRRKKEVLRFAEHLDENLQVMRQEIIDGTIQVGDYHFFTIFDPKERVICAAPFRERVLQHAIMNVCHQYFDRTMIDTTYATRQGKGVYAALDKAVEATTRYKYTAKLDVRKYYDSIDHDVLKGKLRRMFKDASLLSLFDKIIDSYCVTTGKGLPIGNLTSQYFANMYLSELDHKAKELWGATIYIRYMDDILVASNDKLALRLCVEQIERFSSDVLKLTIKPPIFKNAKDGQVYLGYRVLPYHYRLSGRSKKRFRSKRLNYEKRLNNGIWNETEYEEHILPLTSFTLHAESKAFRKSCLAI